MSSSTPGARWPAKLVGLLTLLFGLALLFGGAYLAVLGGSLYFVLMGLATSVAGFFIFTGRSLGSILFGIAFVVTVFWSLWDAGLDFWPLVSRLFALGCLGLLIALITPSLSGRKTG